ncbi:MAG: hypothetical protein K8R63_13055 [Bacteroidales bacterium]|nr:hypothetical protein [Bacteroidales bacterium]
MSTYCPRCGNTSVVKSGFVKQQQRHYCKKCFFHFTINNRGVPPDIKRLALHLYLEGLSYRAISRVTGVSDVAIAKWIRPVKKSLRPLRKQQIRVTELHRLEHFFITKELFNKFGWLLIGLEENKDVCLFGSYTSGNCRIEEKGK